MIKSEKAYDIIHSNYPKYPCEGGDIGEVCYETDDTVTCIDAAEEAIEQAESDARDRAVRAACKSCASYNPCQMRNIDRCDIISEFKQAYDNE